MGVFNTTRQFTVPQDKITAIANDVMDALRRQGYDVQGQALLTGGWDMSIAKGGMFKAVLGLKTALKINLSPRGPNHMLAEASVGIFGQQAVPTILTLFVTWPVIIPQIWGLVRQSKLDDTVMDLIANTIKCHCPEMGAATGSASTLCPACNAAITPGAKFCTGCGKSVA